MPFDFSVLVPAIPALLQGLRTTVLVVALGTPIGIVSGTLAAYGTASRNALSRKASKVYVAAVRNIPFLMWVYFAYFALPKLGISMSAFHVGVVTIALYTGGYFSEVMRAGFRSVSQGQYLAARALGLSPWQVQTSVIVPQLIPVITPATVNLAIQALKDSALLSVIGLKEMTYQSQVAIADTFAYVEFYGVAALLYWLVSMALEAAGHLLEYKIAAWKRR